MTPPSGSGRYDQDAPHPEQGEAEDEESPGHSRGKFEHGGAPHSAHGVVAVGRIPCKFIVSHFSGETCKGFIILAMSERRQGELSCRAVAFRKLEILRSAPFFPQICKQLSASQAAARKKSCRGYQKEKNTTKTTVCSHSHRGRPNEVQRSRRTPAPASYFYIYF